jgi:hypothetical protein
VFTYSKSEKIKKKEEERMKPTTTKTSMFIKKPE